MKRNDFEQAPGRSPRPDAYLRLQASASGENRIEVPLFARCDGEPNAFALDVCPGTVRQSQRYRIDLFSPDATRLAFSFLTLSVNGEEFRFVRHGSGLQAIVAGGEVMRGFELDFDPAFHHADECSRPFALICGYARMRVTLYDERRCCVGRYAAKDIACCQDDPVDRGNVNAMMSVLASSPEENRVIGWMSGDALQAKGGAYSILQGGLARNSSRSTPTYLSIIDEGLSAMEEAFPSIRGHAAFRVQAEEAVVDAASVTRTGAAEMRWLAAHPDVLRPATGRAAVTYAGRGYVPGRMLSAQAARSFDVYENRVCLAYLDAVARGLADFGVKVRDNRCWTESLCLREGSSREAERHSFSHVAAAALHGAHRAYAEAAEKLRLRALRLAALYRSVLPGVKSVPLSSLRLMRTKVFKEVRAYSLLYRHIERFCSYGEEVPGEDGLAVAALRLDRAYETYVLYCLLEWLRTHAFELDAAWLCAYDCSSNPYYERSHVNNAYRLTKDATTVELFYEPVVSHDGPRPAAGHSLRRMRPGYAYTPDFVLTVTTRDDGGCAVKKTFVLDAKYRPRRNVLTRFVEGKPTQFEDCVRKYAFGMVDAETLRIPDALWLVCGLEDEGPAIEEAAAAAWTAESAAMPSGVALLTPRRGADSLFRAMGLAAPEARDDADTVSAPAGPAVPGGESAFAESSVFDGELRALDEDLPVVVVDGEESQEEEALVSEQDGSAASSVLGAEIPSDMSDAHDAPSRPDACELSDSSDDSTVFEAMGERPAAAEGVSDAGDVEASDRQESPRSKKTPSVHYDAARAKEQRRREEKKAKKRAEKRKRRQEAKAAASAQGVRADAPAPLSYVAAKRERGEGVACSLEEIVVEIVESTRPEERDSLFELDYCRRELGLGASLLNRRQVRNYLPLPGYDGVFYLSTKLPTYRCALEKHRDKLKGA